MFLVVLKKVPLRNAAARGVTAKAFASRVDQKASTGPDGHWLSLMDSPPTACATEAVFIGHMTSPGTAAARPSLSRHSRSNHRRFSMRPQTQKAFRPPSTWAAKRQGIANKAQKAATLKNAQLGASRPLIYQKGKKDQLYANAANVMQDIGTVLNNSPEGQALVRGTNSKGDERVATKGFSLSRWLFKNTKAEEKAGAGRLNTACRILKEHPDPTIRAAASSLQGYINMRATTNTPALRLEVNGLNQAVRESALSNNFLTGH